MGSSSGPNGPDGQHPPQPTIKGLQSQRLPPVRQIKTGTKHHRFAAPRAKKLPACPHCDLTKIMTLQELIAEVQDWQTKQASQLFSDLSARVLDYEDESDWTWKGIAGVVNQDTGERFGRHGCKLLQDALLAAGEGLWVSQISSGMPLTDPEIQGVLRYLDEAGSIPGARFIADAVLRKISVLEQNNITTTVEEVAQVQASMKHEQRQQALLAQGANVWNTFVNAVENLQVHDPDPVLVMQHALAESVL